MKKINMILASLCLSMALAACGQGKSSVSASAETDSVASEAAETSQEETTQETEMTADEVLSVLSYDVTECVKLGDYKNMTVDMADQFAVTDEDVEEMVKAFAVLYPNTYVASDKKVIESGDAVLIDYTGYLDGKEFDGGSATDYLLVIGSKSFIDGFEDGLIGGKVGEIVSVPVTFPENYGVDTLNGKDVEFKVAVKAIKEPKEVTYETLTDEWAADNFASMGVTNLEDLRSYIHDYVKGQKDGQQDTAIQDAVMEQIIASSEINIPEDYMEMRIEMYKKLVYDTVEESGKTFEEAMGGSEEEFLKTLPDSMEKNLQKKLILDALVKDLDITFTETRYQGYVQTYMQSLGYTEASQLYDQLGTLSELDGEAYCRLVFAEHLAWVELKKMVNITGIEE